MRMDYHLHSTYSGDGQSPIVEICAEALRKGLTHIAITDHHDSSVEKYRLKEPSRYLQEIERCRLLFPGLDIAKGIELDYREETWSEVKRLPRMLGLDFALLSLHYVDGVDPFFPGYFEGRSRRESYELYLQRLAKMIAETDGPWVLGHFTYVAKFAPFGDARLRYDEFPDELDHALRLAAENGYGLEVNASGIKNGAGVLPDKDVLMRFRELGGEAITVGSDAHCAADTGRWTDEATQAVRAAGFRYLAIYRNLTPEYNKID